VASLADDVSHLAGRGLLAFPTETVWGLAANADDPDAVAGIVRFKGRSEEQPISLLVVGPEVLEELGADLSAPARRLLTVFWPGPLTLVLRTERSFGVGIARAGDGAVGFRCSPHPTAAALVRAAAAAGLGPLTATSCNLTGRPAAKWLRQPISSD
jgi:L-threonylcarbamoyladenylate synthase